MGTHNLVNPRFSQLLCLLSVLAVTVSWPCVALAQNPPPTTAEPATAQLPEMPVDQPDQRASGCSPDYDHTPTSCTIENRKMVRTFDDVVLIGMPILAILVAPFLATKLNAWWVTRPLRRTILVGGCGVALVSVLFLALPVLAERGLIAPQIGFAFYTGIDPNYLPACRSCAASVTNEYPFYGWISFGMDRNGLAIQQPFALLFALITSIVVFGAVSFAVFRVLRGFRGVDAISADWGRHE